VIPACDQVFLVLVEIGGVLVDAVDGVHVERPTHIRCEEPRLTVNLDDADGVGVEGVGGKLGPQDRGAERGADGWCGRVGGPPQGWAVKACSAGATGVPDGLRGRGVASGS